MLVFEGKTRFSILKIFKDFTKVSLSNYISRAIAALISIILARWLGPIDFGVFSIGFYILTIFGLGFTGFDQSYVYFTVRFPKEEQEIFSTYVTLKVILAIFFIFIFILFCFLPISWNFEHIGEELILYGLIGGLGMNILNIGLSFFQAKEEFNNYSIVQLVYYLTLLFLVFLGVKFNLRQVNFYLLMYLFPSVFILNMIFRKGYFSILKFKIKIAQKFWNYGNWLILSHFVRLINLRADFFWLGKYFKGEILGQYSVALSLINIFVLLIGTFYVILLPKASAIETDGDLRKYWLNNRWCIVFLLISWFMIYFLSPFFIEILYGARYKEATLIFKMLLYSVIPLIFTLPIECFLLGAGKTIYVFLAYLVQGISLILAPPILVGTFRLNGIIYGRVISFCILLIFYFIEYKFVKEKFLEN
ncbi:MAG: oligosaccharide flippase family protein [candidate division WOR-3 bacterium]